MLRKNKGYFFAEVLISLSAWLIIASVYFPMIASMSRHSVQLDQDLVGTQLFYETLLKARKEDKEPLPNFITVNNTVYEIGIELREGSSGSEVCIQYEDIFNGIQKKCELFE